MAAAQPSPLSPLAERYWQSRQAKPAADSLERFLTQRPDLNADQLTEVLLVDQMLAWRQAPGPNVEQYLQRFPTLADRPQAVLELLYGEIRLARAGGLPVDVDAYVARFPDLAEPLRRQLELSAWLADDGNDGGPGDSARS